MAGAIVFIGITVLLIVTVIGTIVIKKIVDGVLGRAFMCPEVQKLTKKVAKESLKETIEIADKLTKK